MPQEAAIPLPRIKRRTINNKINDSSIKLGVDPLVARVLAARDLPDNSIVADFLSPKLSQLTNPNTFADIDKAAIRIAQAIINGECIGLETDHDCDGQTSHAVLYYNLVTRFGHPEDKIKSYIGHRLNEGYGLSESLANRILAEETRVSLVVTADNGSSDEPRIKLLKDAGIDVIVTDHHDIPSSGYPSSAYACLNPRRSDCNYPDPYIAGCMVAWLLMTVVRAKLIEQEYLPKDAASLVDSLDFVAVGTIADCVSMASSINNRIVVHYGLKLINMAGRACWRAVKNSINRAINAEDLGFKIGPLLNSDGRLCSAFKSVNFLLSDSDVEAEQWIEQLQQQNEARKKIQKKLVSQGIEIAKQQLEFNKYSLSIFLDDSHPGVHGIAASRIKDLFGRPTVFLTPKHNDNNIITGSARSIDDFHIRDALQYVADCHPDLFIAFGGHKGAAGLSFARDRLDLFVETFEQAAKAQLTSDNLGPVLWTDGTLVAQDLKLDLVQQLDSLQPFGREFEMPVFELAAVILELKPVGDFTHAKLLLDIGGVKVPAIWFGMRQDADSKIPVAVNDAVELVASVTINEFRATRSLQLNVIYMRC